jgi:PKD repeat protein
MKIARLVSFLLFSCLFIFNVNATPITIGTGTQLNTGNSYPAPYGNWYFGAKHQFLITAAELTAAGMSAGNINNLSFMVGQAANEPLQDFTVAIKNTSTSSLTAFETGLTTVLNPQTYTDVSGINTHTFLSPFYWNGSSNLLIETCFNNTMWSQNAGTYYSTTSFNSTIYYRADQTGICSTPNVPTLSNDRPNIIFDWTASAVPPVANFSANTTFTCSGIVGFTDLSLNNPTSWSWDFGDANSSTSQNPTHTYTSNGTYSVTLIACNAYGCDTITFNNYITVNAAAPTPIAASCSPNTLTYCCGFGITNIAFNTINNSSNDGADGYSDFTCTQTTVLEGQTYSLSIQSAASTTQDYAAWIDFNNDGILDDVSERVFTASSEINTSGSVTIPIGATLNTPLRLRVSADYDFSAAPTPCTDMDYGQAEDYTVIITSNPNPPTPIFTASPTTTCSGIVCFTDLSLNAPTGWLWYFGDGATSFQQNPCHTYTTDGTYTVTLIATNANGGNTDSIVNYITVNTLGQVITPSCTPITSAYCCDYGIYQVDFNTISNSTLDGIEGYQDFTCSNSTQVTEGLTYALTIKTGLNNPQDTRVWIDFDNDGTFNNTNELVMDAPNSFNPTLNITIPLGGVLYTPLRMRVSSDLVGTIQSACDNNDFGQTEDYGIIIKAPGSVNDITSLDNSFLVYPNPVKNSLKIKVLERNTFVKSIEVYNSIGKILMNVNPIQNNQLITFSVSSFAKGFHFIKITADKGIVVKKVTVY